MKAMQPSAAADELAVLREHVIDEIRELYLKRRESYEEMERWELRELVGQRVLHARALEVAYNALEGALEAEGAKRYRMTHDALGYRFPTRARGYVVEATYRHVVEAADDSDAAIHVRNLVSTGLIEFNINVLGKLERKSQ